MILFTLLALGLPSVFYGIYSYFQSLRRLHSKISSLPRNLFVGNMFELGKYMKGSKHPDYGMRKMWEDLGQPEIFFVDILPLHGILVVADPSIAEQLTRPSSNNPYSVPKSWTVKDIEPLVGGSSILSAEGEEWKSIRKQFQPGFQPKHLQTLLPQLIAEIHIFLSRLEVKTKTSETFRVGQLTSNLALDVIATVTLGHSFQAQTVPEGEGVRGPKGLLTAFIGVQNNINNRGQVDWQAINPFRMLRLYRFERLLGEQMREIISSTINDSSASPTQSSRSVVHLALKDRPLTPAALKHAGDQLRTFIFAGFDTTSTTLQWTFYYLSLPSNRHILDTLIAEHDAILGPLSDPNEIDRILITDPALPFTTAVIKEALRIQPPAATARWIPPSSAPVTVTIPGSDAQHTLNGLPIYISHAIIHTSPKVWGPDALVFRPSRWLDKEYVAALPPGSWRPFERGPRACIGQELALLEAKMVVALTVRRFAFERVNEPSRQGKVGPEVDIWTGEGEVWNKYSITSTPSDGMMMKVHVR